MSPRWFRPGAARLQSLANRCITWSAAVVARPVCPTSAMPKLKSFALVATLFSAVTPRTATTRRRYALPADGGAQSHDRKQLDTAVLIESKNVGCRQYRASDWGDIFAGSPSRTNAPGARDFFAEAQKWGQALSVVRIPKTIDNDIPFVARSFGFPWRSDIHGCFLNHFPESGYKRVSPR